MKVLSEAFCTKELEYWNFGARLTNTFCKSLSQLTCTFVVFFFHFAKMNFPGN